MESFQNTKTHSDSLNDVANFLKQNKLYQYYDTFIAEGFDTLVSIYDITEYDLKLLNVKRGHRRLLQRAIATSRGIPVNTPLSIHTSNEETAYHTISNPGTSHKKKVPHYYKRRKIFTPARPITPFDEFHDECKYKEMGLNSEINRNKMYERWHSLTPTDKEKYERQALHANSDYVMDMMLSEEESMLTSAS